MASIGMMIPRSSDTGSGSRNANSGSDSPENKEWKCCSKETCTCLFLSTIVIGLPIAIIIILMHLPKLSSSGDNRQQNYILLAFGFPFSLVFLVSLTYGIYRCIVRWRRPHDHSHHFRSLSWRHLSRRFRSRHRRFAGHHIDDHHNFDDPNSPRFYSIVTQVMAAQQVFPDESSARRVRHLDLVAEDDDSIVDESTTIEIPVPETLIVNGVNLIQRNDRIYPTPDILLPQRSQRELGVWPDNDRRFCYCKSAGKSRHEPGNSIF